MKVQHLIVLHPGPLSSGIFDLWSESLILLFLLTIVMSLCLDWYYYYYCVRTCLSSHSFWVSFTLSLPLLAPPDSSFQRLLTWTWSLPRCFQTRLWDEGWSFLHGSPAWQRVLHRWPAAPSKHYHMNLKPSSFKQGVTMVMIIQKKEPHWVKSCFPSSPLTLW